VPAISNLRYEEFRAAIYKTDNYKELADKQQIILALCHNSADDSEVWHPPQEVL